MNGAVACSPVDPGAASEPTSQCRNWSNVLVSISSTALTNAPRTAAAAAPATTRVAGVVAARPVAPIMNTATAVRAAPASANHT